MAEKENTQGGTVGKGSAALKMELGDSIGLLFDQILDELPESELIDSFKRIRESAKLGAKLGGLSKSVGAFKGGALGGLVQLEAELLPWANLEQQGWLRPMESLKYMFDEDGRKEFEANMHTRQGLTRRLENLERARGRTPYKDFIDADIRETRKALNKLDLDYKEPWRQRAEAEIARRRPLIDTVPPPKRHGWDETLASAWQGGTKGAELGAIFGPKGLLAGTGLGALAGLLSDYTKSPIGKLGAQDRLNSWQTLKFYLNRDAGADYLTRMQTDEALLKQQRQRVSRAKAGSFYQLDREKHDETLRQIDIEIAIQRGLKTPPDPWMKSRPIGNAQGVTTIVPAAPRGANLGASISNGPAKRAGQGGVDFKQSPSITMVTGARSSAGVGAVKPAPAASQLGTSINNRLLDQSFNMAQASPQALPVSASALSPQSGGSVALNYSPTISIAAGAQNPDAVRAAVDQGLASDARRLKTMIREIMREERRLAYA
ncbi:hypothetical protein [Desulfocurvibacter africanus]|uniref:Uncharacterized protein n=1 Tax=Desulfocurvibacter africanus subsp. africanus str. Walvis Bay TaxID=690850 RepID=F3YY68_DESAF|nr:hypothetical protein [Desulfocurvibacter africanus]EGJ51844.1 hypothetical protein Desaf_3564 [Desulfocurvibacter africanus subsp. africanus str. Walvis Bay]